LGQSISPVLQQGFQIIELQNKLLSDRKVARFKSINLTSIEPDSMALDANVCCGGCYFRGSPFLHGLVALWATCILLVDLRVMLGFLRVEHNEFFRKVLIELAYVEPNSSTGKTLVDFEMVGGLCIIKQITTVFRGFLDA
jgi:hypothetical protein